MAQFRNVSGQDRHLALPDWYAPKFVEAGGVVDVEDAVANAYDFNQPGVWEAVAPAAPVSNNNEGGN
jgi:hypothetical protein